MKDDKHIPDEDLTITITYSGYEALKATLETLQKENEELKYWKETEIRVLYNESK